MKKGTCPLRDGGSKRKGPTALRAAGFLDKPSWQLGRQPLPNPPPAQDSLFCYHKGQTRMLFPPHNEAI